MQVRWETMLQQELAEETRTEISEAEEIPEDEVDTEVEVTLAAEESPSSRRPSVNSLAPGDRVSVVRHNILLNLKCIFSE